MVLTYSPVNRLLGLPRFLAYARKINKHLDATPAGLVGYSLLAKPHRSRHWALPAWADGAALAALIVKARIAMQ